MTTRKEQLKGRLRAWMSRGSPADNYGFGANWSLNIGKKGTPIKSFWLGQGAKVTSRMLGMDYGDYIKDASERAGVSLYKKNDEKKFKHEGEWMGNKKINKVITEDVLHTAFGDEYEGGWMDKINSQKLKKLIKAQDWDLAVQ